MYQPFDAGSIARTAVTDYHAGWRGTLGYVKPTYRPTSLDEYIRLLPTGVSIVPMHAGIERGSTEEFEATIERQRDVVAKLADIRWVDAIMLGGMPMGMMLGHGADREFVDELSEEHGLPVSMSSLATVSAMKEVGITRLVGLTYVTEAQREYLEAYLTDAGLEVAALERIETDFESAGRIPGPRIYSEAKRLYQANPDADGIYLFGGAWRVMGVIDLLETDLKVPVVFGNQAGLWSILDLLQVGESIPGFGALLRDHT